MAIQTATNPETGERVALINGQWVPISQSATSESGQKAYLVNNQWMTDTAPAQKPEEQSIFREVADVPLKMAQGAVQGVRMIADAFGAGSETSNTIRGAEDYLAGLMSAQSKNDSQEVARIMQNAEDAGVLDQVKAGLEAFSVAPVDTLAQGLGTAAPAVAAGLLTTFFGAPTAVGIGGSALIGSTMGAGVVKGTIYEETKKALLDAGVSKEQAEARAQLAQEYGGENLDMILGGAALGGIASTTGIEKTLIAPVTRNILGKAAAKEAGEEVVKKGITRRIAEGALKEATPELLQAGQEQMAANIALQREGFDVPTMRGVVSSGVLEGLAGAGLGTGVEVAAGGRETLRDQAKKEAARIISEEEKIEPTFKAPEEPKVPVVDEDIVELERQAGMASLPVTEAEIKQVVEKLDREEPAPVFEPVGAPKAPEIPVTAPVAQPVAETPIEKYNRLAGYRQKISTAYRDQQITNEEFENYTKQLSQAKTEAEAGVELSDNKKELLRIANELEKLGEKGRAQGVRMHTEPLAQELSPARMKDMLALLEDSKAKTVGPQRKTVSVDNYFTGYPKELATVQGLRVKSSPAVRKAMQRADDLFTKADQAMAAQNLSPDQIARQKNAVPKFFVDMSNVLSESAGSIGRLSKGVEAVQKGYKRAEPKRIPTDLASLNQSLDQLEAMLAEEPQLPPIYEEMAGQPAPVAPEVEEMGAKIRDIETDMRVIQRRGGNLFKALTNRLPDSEISELGGQSRKVKENPFVKLRAKRGEKPTDLSSLVADGALDNFLPPVMRSDSPQFDEGESTNHIREKLMSGQYYSFDAEQEIKRMGYAIEDIERAIQELMADDEINAMIQEVADEQRATEEDIEPVITEDEAGAAAEREAKEGELDVREKQLDREEELNKREAKLLEERKRLEQERLELERPKQKQQSRKVYRTGSAAMPKGMTAADIVEYEREELGNQGVKAVAGVDLASIPSEELSWVTFNEEDAKQYESEVSEISSRDATFEVVAEDGMGGYLIREERAIKAPTEKEVVEAQERKAKEPELAEREQVRKESEAGAGQFELTREEGRQDTTGGLFEQPTKTFVQSMPDAGFTRIKSGDERQYKDEGGKGYPTFERDGVRVALSSGRTLGVERGDVIVYDSTDPADVIIQAVVVDKGDRQQGKAKGVMQDLVRMADDLGVTMYIEPAPIADKPMSADALRQFYGRLGFKPDASGKAMTREPGVKFQDVRPGRGVQKGGSGAEMFNQAEIENNRTPEYKSRTKLIEMSLKDFLALSEEGTADYKTEGVQKLVKGGKKFSSLPFLIIDRDGRVEGHEGRHRARALMDAGYTTMPVILRSANIRWSEQTDPERFDYTEEWPKRLTAQSGAADQTFSIPFPVSREQADQPYDGDQAATFQDIRPNQTETPAFKRWSRNAPLVLADQALDYDFQTGKPFVAQSFHGTNAEEDFTAFDLEKGGDQTAAESASMGIFSTSSPEVAGNYAGNIGFGRYLGLAVKGVPELKNDPEANRLQSEVDAAKKASNKAYNDAIDNAVKHLGKYDIPEDPELSRELAQNIMDMLPGADERKAKIEAANQKMFAAERKLSEYIFEYEASKIPQRIMPLFVRMSNPKVYDAEGKTPADFPLSDRIAQAKREGHDGVVFKNIADPAPVAVHYVAFEPNQMKSVTGNIGAFGESANILLDIAKPAAAYPEEVKRSPSFKRRVTQLKKDLDAGKITDDQFVNEVDFAIKQAEQAAEAKRGAERTRGADFIRQKLLEAKRRGQISAEAVDMAEWFITNNEQLVDDLGVSIVSPKEEGVAGQYVPFSRVMVLLKEAGADTTVIHEIMHHLERMMPQKVQQGIRTAWARRFAKEQKKATGDNAKYLQKLFDFHFGDGLLSDYNAAMQMIKDGKVDYKLYQFANPSEFWAVNASDIVQGRFDGVRGGVLQRLKTWLKELGQRIKGTFGFDSDAEIIKALNSLSKGDGKFVSQQMLGEADTYMSVGQNILGQRVLGSWTDPTDTKLMGEIGKDDVIYALQDKQIDTKRVVEAITSTAGKIVNRWNPYLQEELYHGRTAKQTKDFLTGELRPLMQQLNKDGLSLADLEKYLHNRHAEDYNKQVAKVNPDNPDMQDGGSGIPTQQARDYLASLSSEDKKKYERLAKMVDDITKGTRQILVDTGLEAFDTIASWEKAFPNYVPLHREEVDFQYTTSATGTGKGFDVRGPFSRSAMGSKRNVVDIIANIAMQRERAIIKAQKNRVATALYGLAIQNPNPGFWLAVNPVAERIPEAAIDELRAMGIDESAIEFLMKEPRQKAIDPKKNEVIERINTVLRNNDNVLSARVNGENRYVFFNPNNDRAARMAKALKNLDADQLGRGLKLVGSITRWMAAVNTQYNPIFGIYNFLRDNMSGALQLTNTPLAGKQGQVAAGVAPALKAIYSSLRKERKGEKVGSEWAKLWDDFQKAGGQTGFRDVFSRSQERTEALQKELTQMSQGKLRSAGRETLGWLSDFNDSMENAVRLSAYKTALDNGISKEEAASLAKNLTVNFNRKGQVATQAGALYAFFNAAVQGTTRLAQTLQGPAGRKIMVGGLLLGGIQALMLAAAGFDDEEPPEFVRERNFIIPIGDGKYFAVPYPLGYNVIPNTSRVITQWWLSGFKNTPERIANLTGAMLEAFNPLGNAGWSVQTIAPTVADPLVALAENKDWTGKPIAREDFSGLDPTPGYTRSRDSANWLSVKIAEYLNYASGGTKYQPGYISPTADQLEYLVGQAFGGIGRETLKAAETVEKSITGEELPPYKIPLAGRFYGETQSAAAEANRFYKNLEMINKHENEIKGRRENREPVADYLRENPEARLASKARSVYSDIKKLKERKDALIERKASKDAIKAVENQITRRMKQLNDQVEKVQK